jgi:hypothetical protein
MQNYRYKPLTFNYNYPLMQRWTQNFNAGTYEFTLTGFNAMVTQLYFKLVPQSDVGRDLEVQYPVQWFEILSEDGTNIIGSTRREDREDYLNYHNLYENFARDHNYVYRYNHAKDPIAFRSHGVITGYHIYNTREILRINVAIEVPRVLTYTGVNPTAGYYRFKVGKYVSSGLVFNANAATIKAAIEALPPFKAHNTQVTVSGPLANNMTISYGGIHADRDDELLALESLTLDSYFDVSETTPYKRGLPSAGNYSLVVWADTVAKMTCDSGRILVKQT